MRLSSAFIPTTRELPAEAVLPSHQLMLRAGLIRKLSSGLYTWLPLGLRVLNKVATVVREEMDGIGGQEVLMPAIQPAELWQKTQRWDQFGPLMLTMKDRHDRDFCFGPTHEEVVTELAAKELRSYKQLPQTWYQVQMKFRDELRPRFGVMRAREFLMKDAYSFHDSAESLEATYQDMHGAYSRIFERLGLAFRVVLADSGDIGGDRSQEFHVLADSGEDVLAYSENSAYAANVERASYQVPESLANPNSLPLEKISTPNIKSVADQAAYMKLPLSQIVKTLIVEGTDGPVALCVRGDHELNTLKAEKLPAVKAPLTFVDEATLTQVSKAPAGFVGPMDLSIPIYVDHTLLASTDLSCGANEQDYHFHHFEWARDCADAIGADLRNVMAGDTAPDGSGPLALCRGIEVGHIFQLGSKYAEALGATVLGENGKEVTLEMGCYGIGVSRIVAAAIEQNHDENGIIWPQPMAPYDVSVIALNYRKSDLVKSTADQLVNDLEAAGITVLFDDRSDRPGVMFADADLIGIPTRVILGDRGLKEGNIEVKDRRSGDVTHVKVDDILTHIQSAIT